EGGEPRGSRPDGGQERGPGGRIGARGRERRNRQVLHHADRRGDDAAMRVPVVGEARLGTQEHEREQSSGQKFPSHRRPPYWHEKPRARQSSFFVVFHSLQPLLMPPPFIACTRNRTKRPPPTLPSRPRVPASVGSGLNWMNPGGTGSGSPTRFG